MKNKTLPFFALAAFALSANAAKASNTDSASATAEVEIVEPLTISKEKDMDFGKIVKNFAGGTVQMSTSGNLSATGGLTTFGSAQPAQFTINGAAGKSLSVSIPNTSLSGPGTNMPLENFVTNPAIGSVTIGGDGKLVMDVAASLTVGEDQATGTYSGSFMVTVSY